MNEIKTINGRPLFAAGQKIENSGEIFNDYENNFVSGNYTHSEGHQNIILHQLSFIKDENGELLNFIEDSDGVSYEILDNSCIWMFKPETLQDIYVQPRNLKYLYIEGLMQETNSEERAAFVKVLNEAYQGDILVLETEKPDNILSEVNIMRIYIITEQDVDGQYSHVEGWANVSNGRAGHVEGWHNKVLADCGHAEGFGTKTLSNYAHAEGVAAEAKFGAHAEGYGTKAYGSYSHTEGISTTASGKASHTEGSNTKAVGEAAHAEGFNTEAKGTYAHAEGYGTKAIGNYSHAEGVGTIADQAFSHTEGYQTKALSNYSHVQGKFNDIEDKTEYAHVVGGGTDENHRKNIHTIDWNGNAMFAGNITFNYNGKTYNLGQVLESFENLNLVDGNEVAY